MEAIRVKNLSKRYVLGGTTHNSLRDLIYSVFSQSGRRRPIDEVWALDDISFSVNEGETLGIIGRNGAGKSTLLKILSRITKPTAGSVEIHGRVGSLLEVGTGFHNELSGRENIYLNGAILGMKRSEIESKFDEIIAFSEIERFLDTPVKHYSSGMYMRLAFSIAAHLEPEVLIVDEVLAVGDVGFQKKCLGKMKDVGEKGRTVIFVSHDMSAITRLCDRVIWIKDGKLRLDGVARDVVGEYLHDQESIGAERYWPESSAPASEFVRLRSVRVCDEAGKTTASPDIRLPVGVEVCYEVLKPAKVMVPNLHFFNETGTCIFVSHDWGGGWRDRPRPIGKYNSTVWLPGNFLAEGSVYVGVAVTTYSPLEVHFVEWDAVTFNVIDSIAGDSARGDYVGVLPGIVRPILEWKTTVSV
ncbi:MAG TPA: ABC transporter ATP-binding protein [Pyrinomonadaceae bacterium]|nr:ABC transporter ATP-binding protein [Chloracidobacterium sp.]MBP9934155.1 ABC transporter ATP-binding protein [Pyrinomonadaceae bacterium]MBK9436963.1 ABC transporter ATP-binding protein [Chloracidobacterium sp.]MBK9768174.1 ABC transporter ATP-binding protein [Chloracidobacterium sp.]MBL0241957.1 ABC transporter ATP-binding protein [Chloracidobacterium sp.]